MLDFNGALVRTLKPPPPTDGKRSCPEGLTIDSHGNAFVCDSVGSRVCVFNAEGEFVTEIATPKQKKPQKRPPDCPDWLWEAVQKRDCVEDIWDRLMTWPMCVALDDDGLVYVGGEGSDNNMQMFAFVKP